VIAPSLSGLLAGIIVVFPGPGDPQPPTAPQTAPASGNVVVLPDLSQTLADQPTQPLDLSGWKLTLPVGAKDKPTEVERPRADASADEHWFAEASDHAVAFRAPVDGVTTSGSHYPRSELREMSGDGATPAAWSSTAGEHTMRVVEAFTHLPAGKSELVGAQIHDATHDVTVVRLEGSNLYITDGDNPHYKLVTSDYQLGIPFEAAYVVSHGQIRAYFNGVLQTTIPVPTLTGAYFKAGAYTQANCTNSVPCTGDNYGETLIYQLQVAHTDAPTPQAPNSAPDSGGASR
jgi:hypothetical protein